MVAVTSAPRVSVRRVAAPQDKHPNAPATDNRVDKSAQAQRGWGGRSPRYWAAALRLQDERVVAAYKEVSAAPRESDKRTEAFQRLHIEAHFLVIALAHMVRLLEVCAEVLDDDYIKAVRNDFQERAPWIKNLRDVLEHLDEYATGGGRLKERGKVGERAAMVLTFGPSERTYEVVAQLDSWRLPLRGAAETGQRLGDLLANAWEQRFGTGQPRIGWGRAP